jgi:hypothetical protein
MTLAVLVHQKMIIKKTIINLNDSEYVNSKEKDDQLGLDSDSSNKSNVNNVCHHIKGTTCTWIRLQNIREDIASRTVPEYLANPSKYLEDGRLLVHDPAKNMPRFETTIPNFSIQFVVCDYANNCN